MVHAYSHPNGMGFILGPHPGLDILGPHPGLDNREEGGTEEAEVV